jgi:hypothetical protein
MATDVRTTDAAEIPSWQLVVLLGRRRASVSQRDGRWSAMVGRRAVSDRSLDRVLRRGLAGGGRRSAGRS